MTEQRKKNTGRLTSVLTVCGAILLAVVVGALIVRSRTLELRLDNMLLESIVSHTTESGSDAKQLVDDTRLTLQDAVQMLEQDGRPLDGSWANPLLSTMNLGARRINLRYLGREDLDAARPGSEEQRVYQQLSEGACVVGGVISGREEFYFLVVQPVEQGGEIAGAVQAKVSADLLSQQGHDSVLFRSARRVIAGDDGRVVCGDSQGLSLAELGMQDGLSRQQAEELTAAYQDSENDCFRCGTEQGRAYTAWAPISYNGWRVVQFSQSSDVFAEHSSVTLTLVMLASLLACAALAFLLLQQRSRLEAEQIRYSALAEFKDTLIFEYDCRRDTLRFTPNALEILDLDDVCMERASEMKGRFSVFHPDDLETVRRALWEAELMDRDEVRRDRIRLKGRNGQYSWYRSQYKAGFDRKGRVLCLVGTLTDIDAQINREVELRKQAQQDSLTGVYNRAGVKLINARLEQISRGILFMLDLDDFKTINDTYGHAAGDRVLMAIGGVLHETFRADDIVARVGGDEFIAFLSGSDSRAMGEQKGRELLERVRALRVTGVNAAISVSVGAARAPALGRSYEALSQAADEAMYQVKQDGKNGFLLR